MTRIIRDDSLKSGENLGKRSVRETRPVQLASVRTLPSKSTLQGVPIAQRSEKPFVDSSRRELSACRIARDVKRALDTFT